MHVSILKINFVVYVTNSRLVDMGINKTDFEVLYDAMVSLKKGIYTNDELNKRDELNLEHVIVHRGYTVEENLKRVQELNNLHNSLFGSLDNNHEFEKFRIKLIGYMVDSSIDFSGGEKRHRTLLRKSILNGLLPFKELPPIEDMFALHLSTRTKEYFCLPNRIVKRMPDVKIDNVAYSFEEYSSMFRGSSKQLRNGIDNLDELYQVVKHRYSLLLIYREFTRFVIDNIQKATITSHDDLVVDTSKINKLYMDTKNNMIKIGILLDYDEVKQLILKTMSDYNLREECGVYINSTTVKSEIDGLKELYG